MGFTLPCTRLAFKHLRPLSYQRLGPPATLTTWVSTLYMRLTDCLKVQDAILESLLNYIIRHHHETFAGLHPNNEVTPWAPTKKGHEITSWTWGTTTKPSWNYVLTMRHHHEISPRDSWNYVLNHTKIMSNQPT